MFFVVLGHKTYGIPYNVRLMCDVKSASYRYIKTVHGIEAHTCFFVQMADVAAGFGKCLRHHGTKTVCDCHSNFGSVDFVCIGTPCTPFSKLRDKSKVPPHEHPAWQVTFEFFKEYLGHTRPKGGMLENVTDFMAELHPGDGPGGEPLPKSWLDRLCDIIRGFGYVVCAFKLNSCDWCDIPRDRISRAHFHSSVIATCWFVVL